MVVGTMKDPRKVTVFVCLHGSTFSFLANRIFPALALYYLLSSGPHYDPPVRPTDPTRSLGPRSV